jgi:hypothetical protein
MFQDRQRRTVELLAGLAGLTWLVICSGLLSSGDPSEAVFV